MKMVAPGISLASLVILLFACGPGGSSIETAPALLDVDPLVLHFGPEVDTETVLVKNKGAATLSFDIQVNATSDSVQWLKVSPESGAVEGGGATGVLVSVMNREKLQPGDYQGKVVVVPEGLDAMTVNVNMTVGQPVLSVDPSDVIDFGTEGTTRNVTFKNAGQGKLNYAIELPAGGWLTTEAVLQKEILPNEPQTVVLTVLREAVPWYGKKSDYIVVTSNGADDDVNSSTLNIEVMVEEDDSCEVDANCAKPGHYCKVDEDGEGHCKLKKDAGQQCSAAGQCKTGVCSDEVCCDVVCEGDCMNCALADTNGTCVASPKDFPCSDDDPCTVGDACSAGECLPGVPMDCSDDNSDCTIGVCDPEIEGCVAEVIANSCLIDDKCRAQDEGHPFKDCLACRPDDALDQWSVIPGHCHIEGECFEANEALTEDGCVVCDLEHPEEASSASDGAQCVSDENDCTDDVCQDGVCEHVADATNECSDGDDCTHLDKCEEGLCAGESYECETELTCAENLCDGDGGCVLQVAAGSCVIGDVCYETAQPEPNSGGCLRCIPANSQFAFTPDPNGATCTDNSPCTLDDKCQAGQCLGAPVICDDEVYCTKDSCDPDSGQCKFEVIDDFCLIDGICQQADASPGGEHGDCQSCQPLASNSDWTWTNEDGPCDDLSPCSAASTCKVGQCVPTGPLCDDGLACTLDQCTEANQCEYALLAGFCLIDGVCHSAGAFQSGSGGCAECDPQEDGYSWTLGGIDVACNDGDLCTVNDACLDGECHGTPKNCDDGKYCTQDACEPVSGQCSNIRDAGFCIIEDKCRETGTTPLGKDAACLVCDADVSAFQWVPQNEDSACDDLSPCTLQSICDNGECVAVGALCDDANECTVDVCTGEQQCVHTNKDDQTACQSDGVGCTDDVCVDGECKHPMQPDSCHIEGICRSGGEAHPDNFCLACVPVMPTKWSSVNEGLECADGLWCTVDDICMDGICAGPPRVCSEDPCNTPQCLEDSKECVVVAKEEGEACDDGDPCTIADQCSAGLCEGADKDCSPLADGNQCLYAFCNPNSQPEPGQCAVEPYQADHPCDDGLYCTTGEMCDGEGDCAGAVPRDCDIFGQCVGGYCDEELAQCVSEPKEDNSPCNSDSNGCTDGDYCLGQQCKPGLAPSCSHVADTCNNASCVSTGPDTYSCVPQPKGEGTPCDDGKFCIEGETCDGLGDCGKGLPKDCSSVLSGQQCKIATCDEGVDLCIKTTAPDGWVCDDDDDCTLEDECTNGQCIGAMDGCGQRRLTWQTQGTDPKGFPFVPQIINLGEGDIMTLWRNYDKGVTTRVVDRELSKSWTDITASWKEDFPSGDCFNELTSASIAARSTGEWVVAMGYRWSKLTDNPFPQTDNLKVYYRISYAAFNKKMEQVKTPTDLWSGTVLNKDQGWKPKCSDLPSSGIGWPQDYVTTFSFSDGAYGILVKVQDGVPQYYPISSGFAKGTQIPVGNEYMYHISGCVLPNNNIGLVWYNNGYVGAGVVNRSMNWVAAADYVAQFSGDATHQWFPRCGALPNGRWVVAFNSYYDGGPAKLYFQVYNSNGTKYGSLKTVTNGNTGHTMGPSGFSDSGFAMTWQQLGIDSDGYGIAGRGFSSSASTTTNVFQVNDVETGNQFWPMHMTDGNEWLAVWSTRSAQQKYDWYFKRMTRQGGGASGAPERLANQDEEDSQSAGHADGTGEHLAMVWQSQAIDGNGEGVSLRLFDSDGLPITPELLVNEETQSDQFEPAVAVHAGSGRVLVAWTTTDQGQGKDVMARLFDTSGNPLSDEFQVNEDDVGDQNEPSVVAVKAGFVVAWTSDTGNGNQDVMARTMSSFGSFSGGQYLVNANGAGNQFSPILMSQGENKSTFVAAWLQEDGSGQDGIYLRKIDKSGVPQGGAQLAHGVGGISSYSADQHSSGMVGLCWRTSSVGCRLLTAELGQSGNSFTVGNASSTEPSVVVRDNNLLWVVYQEGGFDQSGQGVIREELNFTGSRTTFPILVNWYENGNQSRPFTTAVGDDVTIGWESDAQDGSAMGIFYRVLD